MCFTTVSKQLKKPKVIDSGQKSYNFSLRKSPDLLKEPHSELFPQKL